LRALAAVLLAFAVLAAAAAPSGCGRVYEPANRPLDACAQRCAERASKQCSRGECERGCEFIVDRVVEGEADGVIACVARRDRRCTDVVWAECAAHVGPHADGGPPAPPPPNEDWE
jgi:hypothetical protein